MKYRSIVLCVMVVAAVATFLMAIRFRSGAAAPADIGSLIDRADQLVVIKIHQKTPVVVFQSTERHDLEALKTALHVEIPGDPVHCMCSGNPAIVLYARGEKIGQITNHHGKLVRLSEWKSDAHLLDAEAFLKWFDDRKIPEPRREVEKAVQRTLKEERCESKWVAAMPASLQPLWPAQRSTFHPDIKALQTALATEFPVKKSRILALFSWYGSGTGYWSGYPVYEDVAEKLLLGYPTVELLDALKDQELSGAETEGAARLFAGWDFRQKRPGDLGLLPPELRKRLLTHSMIAENEDKRSRALQAFDKP
jgi:hypothetical protein